MATGLQSPKYVFIVGVLILLTGLGINHIQGLKGVLHLRTGQVNRLVADTPNTEDVESNSASLGYAVVLDSVRVRPHAPVYELKLWKQDSMPANPHMPLSSPSKTLVKAFPLEEMKIQKVGDTDLRFRLKNFYPDFEFAYEYPSSRDTLVAKAPGITLRLKTKEGEPIVTLLREKPGPSKLDDIVSLGASLHFYWNLSEDSLNALTQPAIMTGNKVVFVGAEQKVFLLLDGLLTEQPLTENLFYNMPGQDSTGFTILFCFPDAAYLKAVPSTKGPEMLNPVAHVEIWKSGGSAKDAYVYPETSTKKGGDFIIPTSNYKIGMDILHQASLKYCECHVTLQHRNSESTRSLHFSSGQSIRYQGYLFTPIKCQAGFPGIVTIEVSKSPGRILMFLGACIALLSLLFMLLFHKNNKT